MTRIQRRLLIDTSVLGVTLTLVVALLDFSTRALAPLDDWFYDVRADYCQRWTPPPTDQLVFLDVDDAALTAIGKWPWPRTQIADLLDEINAAGAKAVAMDIVFSEPSPVRLVEAPGGKIERIDDDANFAAAIGRHKNVLVPVSLTISGKPSPLYLKLYGYLKADLELSEADCYQRLLADPDKVLPPGSRSPTDLFIQARRDAMNARLAEALGARDVPAPELRRTLLPKTDPEFVSSPLYRLLDEELKKVQAIQPLTRFMRPVPASLPGLAEYSAELAPIREFSLAAAHGGYVDYLQTNDAGAVRAIPLAVSYRGRLFPQMDLVLACAALDVDPRTVTFTPDAVVIPKPPGRAADVRIPVRPVYSPAFGRDVALFMDVPVRGTNNWEFIFDHKRHQKSELHVSMAAVWDVRLTRDRIARNNENLDRALRTLLDDDVPIESRDPPRLGLDAAKYKQFLASRPAPEDLAARLALVEHAKQQLKETGLDALPAMKDSELPDARERVKRDEVAAALRGIDRAVAQNKRFDEQLKARRAFLKEKIAGRAVLIGWVGTGQLDRVPTAIQPACPGVVVHGLMFNGIMTGDLWWHAPKWVTLLITLLIGLAVTAANGFLKPPGAAAVAVLLAAAYLLVNGYLLFDYGNLCVGVAGPMVTLGCVWSTGAVAGFLIEAAERARITKRFSSYTDPKLVDYFLSDPAATFKGQVREMSVIFTDLAGFTTLSETLREKTVDILSEYLGVMVPIIRRHDGFVNKFLGDGIMCFYNAPRDDTDHAAHAVQTALEMHAATIAFADELEKRGLPRLAMRCGVSTGSMVVGDSGPADASDYTVLGDTVNFASRLEGANKVTGTSVLISQRTVELLGDRYLVRPVGRLQVVGKTEGVMTCEPLAKIDDATPDQRELVAMTAEMVAAYVSRDFATCVEVADRMDAKFGPTKLATLYRRTSQRYLDEPPGPDFAGNLVLTEK